MVNVLVLGNGARESALGKAFLASPKVEQVFVAPGNAGMALIGLAPRPELDLADFPKLIAFAKAHAALTFVGPEVPLAGGVVDAFEASGQPVFGPTKKLAQLESSKAFAKDFMHRHNLPTAKSQLVTSLADAKKAAAAFGLPVVVKADGLAAGKGVTVAQDQAQVDAALAKLYPDDKPRPVVIEECLQGQEASVLAMFNGMKRVLFPIAQDHKRRFEQDVGPNTGGMGAISPAPQFSKAERQAASGLVDQTLAGMVVDGLYGCGVLYVGLMFTADGPKILEYNLRFGDPETQVLLPQVENDFYQLTIDLLDGEDEPLRLNGKTYCGVVAVNPAYPKPGASLPLVTPNAEQRQYWIPAGVDGTEGQLQSAGGRIFTVLGSGLTLAGAQEQAYARMAPLQGELAVRRDIGWHAL